MACATCGGYYQCGCDILSMKAEVKRLEERAALLRNEIFYRVVEFNNVNKGECTMPVTVL
jgi:hypothetical protein